MNNETLEHYGIPGMRWGKRKVNPLMPRVGKGHAGPSIAVGAKRQVALSERDLKVLDNGGHLSIGMTNKRQAQYDARDRKLVEARLDKAKQKLEKQKVKDLPDSDDHVRRTELGKKKTSTMSNKEMQDLINRMNLERQLTQLRAQDITPARKFTNEIVREIGKELIKETIKGAAKAAIKGDIHSPTDFADKLRGR